jgi:hypothetical protein
MAFVLLGCGASYGTPKAKIAVTENKLPAKGTTQNQILEWIGEPNQRLRMTDGREEWTYVYSEANWRYPGLMWIPFFGLMFFQLDTEVYKVVLTFDQGGILAEVTSSQAKGGSI